MYVNNEVSITVVTAAFNAEKYLHNLIKSLEGQSDPCFEWIIADGGSSDNTLEILSLASCSLRDVKIFTGSDFGIYDALNKAIQKSKGDYYLVVGADDWLDHNCIKNYKKFIREVDADIYTAAIAYESGGLLKRPRSVVWLYGMGALVTGHSVGSVYRKSLHQMNGFYSKKYPIAADCYFVLKSYYSGATICKCDFLAGHFGQSGVSSTDVIGTICELYRVQIALGGNKFIQMLLLILRLLKTQLR